MRASACAFKSAFFCDRYNAAASGRSGTRVRQGLPEEMPEEPAKAVNDGPRRKLALFLAGSL